MLTRMVVLGAAGLALALVVNVSAVMAQEGGGSGAYGDDQQAGGSLLGDGTSEVWAEDGSDLGSEDQARAGGGNLDCVWMGMDPETESAAGPIDWNYMRNPPPEVVGAVVTIIRSCADANGMYVSEMVTLTLPTAEPPTVDPEDLALMARAQLPLPLPEAQMSPPGEQTVNLETWLWVENWDDQTRTATAGGVTATVRAAPVRQTWTFGVAGEQQICHDAGRAYDLDRPPAEQNTRCSYTFSRSSAGEPDGAFQVEVTMTWAISWSSNVGASGDLGAVSRTVTIPTRVAEHQAVGESGVRG